MKLNVDYVDLNLNLNTQFIMTKKGENKQEKKSKQPSNMQSIIPTQQSKRIELTPTYKNQFNNPQDIYILMSPLPLPPKMKSNLKQIDTTIPSNYYCLNTDLKIIQTPYVNHDRIFRIPGLDFIHEDEKDIFRRIDWEGSPARSISPNSDSQSESSSVQPHEETISEEENPVESQSHSLTVEMVKKSEERKNSERKRNSKKFNEIKQVPQPNGESKKVTCNCKKTKCLKLYCDCFRINQKCQGCNCSGCHNLDEYEDQRNNAILALMDRNPDPFSQKIEADKHTKGCNCKKSYCLKKYCECYQAGLKCGQNCKCEQCKNHEDHQIQDESESNHKPFAEESRKEMTI